MSSNPYFELLFSNSADALVQLNQILSIKSDFEALIGRSIAFYQLGQFEDSINDCNNAILESRKRYEGYYRRGLANLAVGKLQAALIDLEEAVNKAENANQAIVNLLNSSVRRCKAQLENKFFKDAAPIPQLQSVQKEVPKAVVIENQERESNVITSSSGKPIYKWFQTETKIGIEINQVLDSQDKLQTKLTEKNVEISFPLQNGDQFELNLDLWGEIVPENSKARVGLNQIEVLLEKKNKNQGWTKLLADKIEEEKEQDQSKKPVIADVQGQSSSFYPSSSKVKKDWSKIDKEIEQDIQKHKDEYGEDAFGSFFKELYDKSDENTRKAMVKSMQTSGGTVLSTNWDEVSKKDYAGKDRPSPPKGQEKKFFGK